MQRFDLIVIGSGSGLDVANAAYQKGLKVAIVEKDKMGGTCLNRGCIPSKLLIQSADVVETIKRAHLFGINVNEYSIDFQKIVGRANSITDSDADEIKNAFENTENPKLFSNECRFVGPKILTLNNESEEIDDAGSHNLITADKILIATGSRPEIPNIKGLEGSGYITSDEALRLRKQPNTLTIVGGGFVACELAHFFGSLGTKINIVQNRESLIPSEDEEVSHKFTELFSKKYDTFLGCEIDQVSKEKNDSGNDNNGNSDSTFHIFTRENITGKSLELVSDQLLVAVGRVPNSDRLDLEQTGIKVDERGYIQANEYLETEVDGIFAIGDVVGRYLFKHNANHEAECAYNNILHSDKKIPVDYTAMPHAIFSSPQIASVGLKEEELRKMGIEYQKSVYPFIHTAMGLALQDKEGFVKFLVDKNTRKILGCHIMGSHESILIHEVLVVMKNCGIGTSYNNNNSNNNGCTIDSIRDTVHIHPALSEVIARAANNI